MGSRAMSKARWKVTCDIHGSNFYTTLTYRVARVVAEKVLLNVLLYVPPITEGALQSSFQSELPT